MYGYVSKTMSNELSCGEPVVKYAIIFLLVLIYACFSFWSQPAIQAQQPAQVPEGAISGHVWFDANCDGRKDANEGNIANAGVVQLVNTGADRVLNTGDRAQTFYTDGEGNWQMTRVPVNWIDDQPTIWAIAVGEGSVAALGYKVSPEGGDSILSGSNHASPTFQLENGVTKPMGEIGLCLLLAGQSFKAYLPALQH